MMGMMGGPGVCPTGEHRGLHSACGFIGCVYLRAWAKARRYRHRLEESYPAESNMHVRGDGRWYVEILCQRALIYPHGGNELCAFTTSGYAWPDLLKLGPEIKPHQVGNPERVCRFPVDLLDRAADILKPKRLPGRSELTDKQRETLRRHAFQGGKTARERTNAGGQRVR